MQLLRNNSNEQWAMSNRSGDILKRFIGDSKYVQHRLTDWPNDTHHLGRGGAGNWFQCNYYSLSIIPIHWFISLSFNSIQFNSIELNNKTKQKKKTFTKTEQCSIDDDDDVTMRSTSSLGPHHHHQLLLLLYSHFSSRMPMFWPNFSMHDTTCNSNIIIIHSHHSLSIWMT